MGILVSNNTQLQESCDPEDDVMAVSSNKQDADAGW